MPGSVQSSFYWLRVFVVMVVVVGAEAAATPLSLPLLSVHPLLLPNQFLATDGRAWGHITMWSSGQDNRLTPAGLTACLAG